MRDAQGYAAHIRAVMERTGAAFLDLYYEPDIQLLFSDNQKLPGGESTAHNQPEMNLNKWRAYTGYLQESVLQKRAPEVNAYELIKAFCSHQVNTDKQAQQTYGLLKSLIQRPHRADDFVDSENRPVGALRAVQILGAAWTMKETAGLKDLSILMQPDGQPSQEVQSFGQLVECPWNQDESNEMWRAALPYGVLPSTVLESFVRLIVNELSPLDERPNRVKAVTIRVEATREPEGADGGKRWFELWIECDGHFPKELHPVEADGFFHKLSLSIRTLAAAAGVRWPILVQLKSVDGVRSLQDPFVMARIDAPDELQTVFRLRMPCL
jgi:hypothetical protein